MVFILTLRVSLAGWRLWDFYHLYLGSDEVYLDYQLWSATHHFLHTSRSRGGGIAMPKPNRSDARLPESAFYKLDQGAPGNLHIASPLNFRKFRSYADANTTRM